MNNVCPLKDVERRLQDVLALWQETEKQYFTPDAFRRNLNNTIQTLRSVTFVLQKQKDRFPAFEEWYSDWQYKMRQDAILRWIITARNFIEKEGDLETHSKARIGIVNSWDDPLMEERLVSPLTEPSEFNQIISSYVPSELFAPGNLLKVERRWVDANLPDVELLEALAHTYQLLSEMLENAHEKLISSSIEDIRCPWYLEQINQPGARPRCMTAKEWDRVLWMDLESLSPIKVRKQERQLSPELLKTAAIRYPMAKDLAIKLGMAKNFREEAICLFDYAKSVFSRDGYHLPTAVLGLSDGRKLFFQMKMDSRSEQLLIMRRLAVEVEKAGAVSLFFIHEAWLARFDPSCPERRATDAPDRCEAFQLIAANIQGNLMTLQEMVERQDDTIIFTDKIEFKSISPNFIKPILDVWAKTQPPVREKKDYLKLHEPSLKSPCLCGSGVKFKKCCASFYETSEREEPFDKFNKGDYKDALRSCRLYITWYILCHRAHTVPFLESGSKESEELLEIDIKALASLVDLLRQCYEYTGKHKAFRQALSELRGAISDARWHSFIDYQRVLWQGSEKNEYEV